VKRKKKKHLRKTLEWIHPLDFLFQNG